MKIGTMINFREHIPIANVTRWWGESCTCARANWKGTLVVKTSPMPNLTIAISTILAQGNA